MRVRDRAACVGLVEDRDRALDGRPVLALPVRHEQVPRLRRQCLAQQHRVAELLAQGDRVRARRDRLAEPVRVVQLPRVVLDERRPVRLAQPVRVLQRALEVGQGLVVRPGPRGVAAGARCVLHHGGDVARPGRVVQQPGQVGRVPVEQRRDDRLVVRASAQGGQLLLDGPPRQLVPEDQAAVAGGEDAQLLRLAERGRPARRAVRRPAGARRRRARRRSARAR